jgi:hypothetical protein
MPFHPMASEYKQRREDQKAYLKKIRKKKGEAAYLEAKHEIDSSNRGMRIGYATGIASGAAAGTAILPGIGTAVGALLGAAIGMHNGQKDRSSKDNMKRVGRSTISPIMGFFFHK